MLIREMRLGKTDSTNQKHVLLNVVSDVNDDCWESDVNDDELVEL